MAMAGAEQTFKAYWASTIYPTIKDDFERLLSTTPTRIATRETKKANKEKKDQKETNRVHEKLEGVLEEVKEKGERRNAYLNLAFTGPIDNTFLQEKISMGKVENMAADMFLRSLPTGEVAETAPSSQEAADDAEPQSQGKAERRAVDILNEQARRPWQIPQMVERGFEIPIMITSGFVMPDLGMFKRLGMDVVVNAVWLAYFWAKQEDHAQAVTALETLILDWPFDFILIEGSSDEEREVNAFKWSVNMSTRVERLRDFVGLENSNLLRIVARAAELVQAATVAHKKPSPEEVQKWLQENVKWGLLHCPDTKTVKRHLDNWAQMVKCPAALNLIEAAVNRWGRDNLLDFPSKLGIIVQKTDSTTLCYVVETLYTRMWRTGQKDLYASSTLGDAVSEILWVKNYVTVFLRTYPAVCDPGCDSAVTAHNQVDVASMQLAKSYMHSPLKFFLCTEGPDKDPTWLQSFPNPATRLTMKHFFAMATGFYKPEISGALSQPKGQRYNVEQFHKGVRVLKCFVEPFSIAYDSLVGVPKGSSQQDKAGHATEAATADAAQGIGEETAAENKKKNEVVHGQLDSFRLQCEKACQKEIDARVVLLVAEGSAVEVQASVTKTRLYQNLTEAATVMGFYDVKNARLCAVFEGQGLTHREPVLDESDFERYVLSLEPLMVPGRDVLWVLGGRTETNRLKLKRLLSKHKLRTQIFHLCYNTKQMMQHGHFQRQGGIANSRSHELLYCCYKGPAPKQIAKTMRQFVDPGTPVFNEVVRNVPVLSRPSHAMVSREVRETSLQAMIGVDVSEEELKDPDYVDPPAMTEEEAATATNATAEASKALVSAVKKKRKLYRQLTGTEVPWFPHDNAIDLIRELCHEAGRPRWVYFGTPAGGAGIHGCVEMGSSVLALCYDEHHRKNLGPFLVQRAVEAMLGQNTMVFNDDVLFARAKQLNLAKEEEKEAEKEDKKKDEKEDEKEAKKKDEKQDKEKDEKNDKKNNKKNDKEGKPKRKRTPSTSSGDFDSSSLDEAPKKKKGKTKA